MQQVIHHLCTLKDKQGKQIAASLMGPPAEQSHDKSEETQLRTEACFNAIKVRLTQGENDPTGGEYRLWKTFESDIFAVLARARKSSLQGVAKQIEAAYKTAVREVSA
jgi:hypothetical protein